MRPPGEIRSALRAAFMQRGACTWREVLDAVPVSAHSPAELTLVRYTVKNMTRSGELQRVGQAKAAESGRWVALYEVASRESAVPQPGDGLRALASVMAVFTAATISDAESG